MLKVFARRSTYLFGREGVQEVSCVSSTTMYNRCQSSVMEVEILPGCMKHVIGKRGRIIKKIREETRTIIHTPRRGFYGPGVLTIKGRKEDCELAKSKILCIQNKLIDEAWGNVTEETVKIDPPYQRHFFIRKGDLLRQLTQDFGGLRICFPEFKSNSSDVTLIGTKENIEAAKIRISTILEDHKRCASFVLIKQKYHYFMLGDPNKIVNRIEQHYNVAIKFPDKLKKPLPNITRNSEGILYCDMVWVYGAAEILERAKSALLKLTPVTLEIEIPHEYHKYIIGKKGEGISLLMKSLHVFIKLPETIEPSSDTVTIVGTAENSEIAKRALLRFKSAVLKEFSYTVVTTMDIEPKYHAFFFVRGAAILQQISYELGGVTIIFPRRNHSASEVTLIGRLEIVEGAKRRISMMVEDVKAGVEVVVIDQKYHGFVIGLQGRNIKPIENNNNVTFRFPEKFKANDNAVIQIKNGIKSCDKIYIYGAPENLQSAKEALLKLIPVDIAIDIPY